MGATTGTQLVLHLARFRREILPLLPQGWESASLTWSEIGGWEMPARVVVHGPGVGAPVRLPSSVSESVRAVREAFGAFGDPGSGRPISITLDISAQRQVVDVKTNWDERLLVDEEGRSASGLSADRVRPTIEQWCHELAEHPRSDDHVPLWWRALLIEEQRNLSTRAAAAPQGQPYWGPGPYGPGPYGHAPYGQPGYGQPPYGQVPYGQDPYAPAPYGDPAFAQGPYGHGPYGGMPYGQPYTVDANGQPIPGQPFAHDPNAHDGYRPGDPAAFDPARSPYGAQQNGGQPPYGQGPYGQGPYGQPPYGQPYPGQPYGGQQPYGQLPPGQDERWAQPATGQFPAAPYPGGQPPTGRMPAVPPMTGQLPVQQPMTGQLPVQQPMTGQFQAPMPPSPERPTVDAVAGSHASADEPAEEQDDAQHGSPEVVDPTPPPVAREAPARPTAGEPAPVSNGSPVGQPPAPMPVRTPVAPTPAAPTPAAAAPQWPIAVEHLPEHHDVQAAQAPESAPSWPRPRAVEPMAGPVRVEAAQAQQPTPPAVEVSAEPSQAGPVALWAVPWGEETETASAPTGGQVPWGQTPWGGDVVEATTPGPASTTAEPAPVTPDAPSDEERGPANLRDAQASNGTLTPRLAPLRLDPQAAQLVSVLVDALHACAQGFIADELDELFGRRGLEAQHRIRAELARRTAESMRYDVGRLAVGEVRAFLWAYDNCVHRPHGTAVLGVAVDDARLVDVAAGTDQRVAMLRDDCLSALVDVADDVVVRRFGRMPAVG